VVGDSLSQPQNVLALIGTPVGYLLDACGFSPEPAQRVIMGGPMMGFTLPSLSVPVVKTSNCILAPTQAELPPASQEMDCIRCGACAEVCPAVLLPQQLLWYSKAKDQDKLKEYNLADCIECGACAYVCPSEIPLVHYYRVAKAEIREQTRDELKAEQAKARFEARNERLEHDKQQRAARNQALALQRQQLMAEQQKSREITQAQQRVAAVADTDTELSKEQIIALREQKKAEARAYQAEKAAQQSLQTSVDAESPAPATESAHTAQVNTAQAATQPSAEGDPRAAAVAAAIARAKAKKAQTEATAAPAVEPAETPVAAEPVLDTRAAAVAAAIARAKAKKAQTEAAAAPAVEPAETPVAAEPVLDTRAAAVAAAIARAKAKKAQAEAAVAPIADSKPAATLAEPEGSSTEATSDTDREAAKRQALAAAIARAQAKRQQTTAGSITATNTQRADNSSATTPATAPEITGTPDITSLAANTATSADLPAIDPRKAAIAAAIARAKAKQQQLSGSDPKDQA
jgi:electron transport complex protein RnfC